MNWQKTPVILISCLFLLTCGIDEYYYLPQISQSLISTTSNTEANINIPSNFLNGVEHYATGYVIFYKIYISDLQQNTITEILSSNSRMSSDYSALYPYTDPSNQTTITSLTTFSSRGYYELELEGTNIRDTVLSKNGGNIKMQFPIRSGAEPFIEYGGRTYFLLRSNGGGSFKPVPENRYFFNSDDLRNYSNATPLINADVSGQSGSPLYAYASMYIASVGMNPRNFSRLYSKPTHIHIFLLTPEN